MAKKQIVLANDQSRNLRMGDWKAHKNHKQNKQTFSKRCRLYVAIPPNTGWIGGLPEQNGFRVSRSK